MANSARPAAPRSTSPCTGCPSATAYPPLTGRTCQTCLHALAVTPPTRTRTALADTRDAVNSASHLLVALCELLTLANDAPISADHLNVLLSPVQASLEKAQNHIADALDQAPQTPSVIVVRAHKAVTDNFGDIIVLATEGGAL